MAAQRLGRYEISQKGMDFILCFRDPASGGFYSSPTERDATTKQDLKVVGYCGLAALATGRMDIARDVGRWLRMLMQAQPCFPQKLYTVYSRAEGLYLTPDPHDVLRYVVLSDAPDDEYFFQIGIAGGFLARLYQATGESEWLALAKEYMRFAEVASDALFRSVRAGKVGWAAALLFTLTGEIKYNTMALRVAAMLHRYASAHRVMGRAEEPRPDPDVTAEMVVWLDEIYQAVASHCAISGIAIDLSLRLCPALSFVCDRKAVCFGSDPPFSKHWTRCCTMHATAQGAVARRIFFPREHRLHRIPDRNISIAAM